MSRQLTDHLCDLFLAPSDLALRGSSDLPRGDRDAVAWDIATTGQAFTCGVDGREVVLARAVLPLPAPTDGAERWVRTPTLAASLAASWARVELLASVPAGTSVSYRTWDGTTWRYWTGSAWATATTTAHWSTKAQIEGNIATHPVGGAIAFAANLSTTSAGVTPAFFGARLGYKLPAVRTAERDVLAALRAALAAVEIPAEIGVVHPGGTAAVSLNGGERSYDWRAVDVAFDGATEVPGTMADAGIGATWTPASSQAADTELVLEGRYRVAVEVRRHRDLEEVKALPAVQLLMAGEVGRAPGAGASLLRTPTGTWRYPAPDVVETDLQLRAVAEFLDDLRTTGAAFRAWLGEAGYRRIVSTWTGRPFTIREITPLRTGGTGLEVGLPEATATWRLVFAAGPFAAESVSTVADVLIELEET